MVARHPLDGENKINIRSNNSNNNLIDDDDAVAIWKPVGIDLEDSARINQEDNLKDSSFVLDDSESSPHPLPLPTNFCDDDSHEHRQQQQQQNQQQQQDHHLLFLDTTTSPVNCSPTEKLEDRITDLEIKLATLSRLWQAQENNRAHSHHRSSTTTRRGTLRHGRGRSGVTLSPVTSYSSLPPLPHAPDSNVHSPNEAPADTNNEQSVVEDYVLAYHDDDDDDLSYSKPYCESPGPPCLVRKRKGKQRRTLSFALLYGEGLDCINHSSADHMVLSDDSNADLMHTPMFLSSEEEEVNDNLHVPIIETSSGNVLKPRPTRRRPLQPRLQEEDIKENVSLVHAQGDEPPVTTSLTPTLDSAAVLASSTTGDALVTAQGPPKETETTLTPPAPVEDPSTRVRNKWLDYLNSVQEATDDLVENQMAEFIQVPQKVEALQSFGFMICCDSFLYVLVILPIRFIWSCLLLTIYAIVPNHKYKRPRSNSNTMTQQPFIPKPYRFHRRHMYQLIQVGIIYTIYRHVLCPISIGKLYHWIRGQEMIKLYVLVAMVEVFDRLMCSLGQDCLDSMYWNTTRQPRTWRMIISVMVVWVYATMHTLILFVHVATLNVAMNSSDQALLTLLISGNFAEIKSTVFKKYNKPQLFKVTASDICERFKLALFMGLVLILNLCQGGGMDHGMLGEFVTMCGFVWCAELLSDWIKHAFVTKYNFIKSSVYAEFGLLLAGDVTGFGHEGVNMDHSHAVVKRLGFPQIPLVCVMGRYVTEALRYFQQASYDSGGLQTQQPSTMESTSKNAQYRMILVCFGFWLVLLLIKIGLGSFLQRRCQNKLLSAPELSVTASSKKKKKKE